MTDSKRVTAPLSLSRTHSGEPLLLLHGLGSSRRDFTAVLPALTGRFDVINVDLPGVGRSPQLEQRPTVAAITDAVEATLDAEGLGRVHVLGNSLGARIALELAVRGRALSVVAIAPSGLNIPPGAALSRRQHGAGPGCHAGSGPRAFWRTVLWALMLDIPRNLDRIECPVTLVQGVSDWVASGQTVRYLPLITGSRFNPLLMAGHTPQSDRPATIARLVEETAARGANRLAIQRAVA